MLQMNKIFCTSLTENSKMREEIDDLMDDRAKCSKLLERMGTKNKELRKIIKQKTGEAKDAYQQRWVHPPVRSDMHTIIEKNSAPKRRP